MEKNNEYFMRLAIKEAKKAYKLGETPIGCVIVKDDKVIARGYNRREIDKLSLNHAEIIAIKKASKYIDDWRLDGLKMYITLEPCCMCAGAIIQARIDEVYYGAKDYRFGADVSYAHIFDLPYNHKVNIKGGILEEECSSLMTSFFKELRYKNKLEN